MKINEIIVESKPGLWANINSKRKRIKSGSGECMRKPGSKGAPTAQNFKDAASEGVSEDKLDEVDFSSGVGELSLSPEQIISQSSDDGTIGTRKVHLFKSGENNIYFFTDDKKIAALVYLFNNRVMAMKNFSTNSGLIYNLFQYIINIKRQKVKLSPEDKLTSDGIKWIIGQIRRPTGFKITDGRGNKIVPSELYSEWENARISGNSGTTEIVIGESKNSEMIRENETRLMPMDIFGSTLIASVKNVSRIKMVNIFETKMAVKGPLNELFNPGKDWKWSFKGSEEAVAVFRVGEPPNQISYQFNAYRTRADEPVWGIEFKNAKSGAGRDVKYGLTGSGNSAEVMSTVADIMRAFLKEYEGKIKKLIFTADEQSRRALYARMAKRLLPTWDLTQLGKNFSLTAPVEHDVAEGPLNEQFDIIEEMVNRLAEDNGVDTDIIWEYFENVDDAKLFETAAWQKKSGKNKNGGLNAKGVASYRRENPGSKLQTAVTTKPSKLKPGSKAAKRRKSFCARMSGMKGPMKDEKGEPTRKALSLKKWNC